MGILVGCMGDLFMTEFYIGLLSCHSHFHSFSLLHIRIYVYII